MITIDKIGKVYSKVNQSSGGRLGIIKSSFKKFNQSRGPQAAASIAYFAFFSLFPLLLVFVSVGSNFLESEQVYQNAIALVQEAIPVSQSLIEENLQRVLDARGAVGIIGLVGLIWSATGVFSGLAYNINLAWEDARRRSFFEKRIVALGMIGALAVLLILSLVSEALGQLLNNFKIPIFGVLPTDDSTFWNLTSKLVPWSLILLLYFALYLWVPSIRVNWKPALWSAVISATAWKAATGGFVWYLQSGLGRYEVVYGSLGAVAALMFLIYIINFITLFGAHLNAAIQGWLNEKEQK